MAKKSFDTSSSKAWLSDVGHFLTEKSHSIGPYGDSPQADILWTAGALLSDFADELDDEPLSVAQAALPVITPTRACFRVLARFVGELPEYELGMGYGFHAVCLLEYLADRWVVDEDKLAVDAATRTATSTMARAYEAALARHPEALEDFKAFAAKHGFDG